MMCGLTAVTVAFGSLAAPVNVWADDDDDEFLEDLVDMDDDEEKALRSLKDHDGDGDIDEDDVDAVATMITVAAISQAAQEQEQQYKAEIAKQQAALEAQKQATLEAQKKLEEQKKAQNVSGIWVSTTEVTLTPGQTFQIVAGVKPDSARNRGISFSTSDPNTATIDASGIIKANNVGSCYVTARSHEGGFQACTYVRVNPAPAQAAQTAVQDSSWMAAATQMVVAAAPGQVVNLVAPKALSFDAGMINALKLRPDVGLLIAYPYNGHAYLMAIPAGYDLTSKMVGGKVSFLSLAAVKDGKVVTRMTK